MATQKPEPPAPGSRALGRVVYGDGPMPCDLMFVSTAPGRDEVRAFPPRPFVGPAGKELMRFMNGEQLPFRRDCYLTNLVKQKPYGKVVSAAELAYWREELLDEIAVCKPEVIVTLGAEATKFFLWPDAVMERTHGLAFKRLVQSRFVTVFPAYNPAAALHSPDLQSYFAADMEALSLGLRHGFSHWQPDTVTTRYELLPLPLDLPHLTEFSVDTEGSARDPWCLTISWEPGVGYLVPSNDERRLDWVRTMVRCAKRVTCQGLLYDLDVLEAMDIYVPEHAFDDTQIMSYLLSLEPQSLKDLAYRHLGAEQEEYTDLVREADEDMVQGFLEMVAKTHTNTKVVRAATTVLKKIADPEDQRPARRIWNQSKFSQAVDPPPRVTLDNVPFERAMHYACRDADLTERLRPILAREVTKRGLYEVYQRDMGVVPIVQRMQHVGMRVDPAHFRGLLTTFTHEYTANQEAIEAELGYELNPNSGPQVATLLFDTLGLQGQRLVKSKTRYSTEDKYLEALRTAHPIVPLIIEGREITKLRSAYAAAILTSMREAAPDVWHVFPNLRITRVVSGRVSAFDPNVLAIPKHSARGKLIRLGFLAGDGHVLLSNDLSQIELRVAAHDSKCTGMMEVFRTGGDIHAALGHRIFGVKPEAQDESKHRLPCKKVNFGIWMGISAKGMSDQIRAAGEDWSESQCQDLINETFKVWPEIPAYQSNKIAEARRYGYVTDFCGRRRYLAGVDSPNEWVRAEAERQAHATPVQSGAQEVFKTWMANVWKGPIREAQSYGVYCEPWLQVHDDLILEVDEDEADRLAADVLDCIPQMLSVPVTAKGAQATTWGDLK